MSQAHEQAKPNGAKISAAIITGGFDRPYAFGLTMALASKGVRLEVIGSDEVESPEMYSTAHLTFLRLQRNPRERSGLVRKGTRLVGYYLRLIRWAATARPKIFHILWNNKLQLVDRTFLMLYYRLLRKKVVFTAHNVNAGVRDGNDSTLNRLTLKIQYRLADHIFVHTEKMKDELVRDFKVHDQGVTVIPFGINNAVPIRDLEPADAKRALGIPTDGCRTILFFGAIRPYKGLEYLTAAFAQLAERHEGYRLVIAGEPKKDATRYIAEVQSALNIETLRSKVIQRIEFVPDGETEVYFKAADVLVLPYTEVYQSGVLFLSYSFGLPVIASDVGSFRDDIIEGRTGYVCQPRDPHDLANTIDGYFSSELFAELNSRRAEIQRYGNDRNSWEAVADITCSEYAKLIGDGKDKTCVPDPQTSLP